MSKTKKIKTVILLIIFAFSIIFMVLGFSQGDCSNAGGGGVKTVYSNESTSFKAGKNNCSFKFTPKTSGYYYIYINNASIKSYVENDNSYSSYGMSPTSNNVYYGGALYDWCYKIYLYRDDVYIFNTSSLKGTTIQIYIK